MSFEKYKWETSCPPVSTMQLPPWRGEAKTQKMFDDVTNDITESIRAKPYGFPINVTFISLD